MLYAGACLPVKLILVFLLFVPALSKGQGRTCTAQGLAWCCGGGAKGTEGSCCVQAHLHACY